MTARSSRVGKPCPEAPKETPSTLNSGPSLELRKLYWLMKSEPSVYAWAQLLKDKRTSWSGVRNYQANNNMKAMKPGDEAFFYHSNEERAIVGVMKIVKPWHPDPSDETGRFGMVDVAPVMTLEKPVTLAVIKAAPGLKNMELLRQSRLSVSPVAAAEWKLVLSLGA